MAHNSRREQRPHDGSERPTPIFPAAPHVRERSLSPKPGPSSSPREGDSASAPRLVARFWGVRGTRPVVPAEGSRFGGNTACLEVRYAGHILIFDAGSGIVALGDTLMREWSNAPVHAPPAPPTLTLLFTHAHHDHLCGFPFFAPLFQPDADIHMLGPDLAGLRFEEILAGYMRSPYFPVDFYDLPSRRHLRSITDGTRLLWREGVADPIVGDISRSAPSGALVVDVLHSQLHPRNGTLVYRISAGSHSLVFATDVEIGDGSGDTTAEQRLIRFARGSDVLVHDAQYSEEDYGGTSPHRGFGHSTPAMAAHIARAAEVGKLVLFHHDPGYADADVSALERTARTLFPEVLAAREGLEICLDEVGSSLV